MNEVLAPAFAERIDRLVIGIEPIDAQRQMRIAQPIALALDGVPYPGAAPPIVQFDGSLDPLGYLADLPRHSSCRHALVFPSAQPKSPVPIRLFDRTRRFVPRRISYPIPADVTAAGPPTRIRRPRLYPGAAYDVTPRATGLRGRVTWHESAADEQPVRWARVQASVNGQVVGRAHGDDRGEFLLLLGNEAGGIGDLPSPLVAQVTVAGPAAPPPVPPDDPLGDLPLELVGDPDDVSPGETWPAGYAATAHSTRAVTFELGSVLTGQDKFFLLV